MIPSPEGLPTKAKEAPSPHEVRLAPLDTNPVFHSLGYICQAHIWATLAIGLLLQKIQDLAMVEVKVGFKHYVEICFMKLEAIELPIDWHSQLYANHNFH